MNNPNVKFISKEKLLNSPEIYHKVNSSKTADEGCNNKWKQSLFQLFFEITKKDNDNLSFLQPPGKFRYQCPPYFCNIFILTANYYTSDKITYNKNRNVIKYYDSSSIQDVEFFFAQIIHAGISDFPSAQQMRILQIRSILLKLCTLSTRSNLPYIMKMKHIDFKKLAKELFLYILDENKESIDFDNLKVFKSIDDFDTKLNLW